MEIGIKLIELVEKWRYKPFVWLIVFLAILVGALYVPLPDGVSISIWNRAISGLIVGAFASVLFFYIHQPPTVKEGHVGIVIAVRSEDRKTKGRISKDFVEACKNILEHSQEHQPFHVIELNDFYSALAT